MTAPALPDHVVDKLATVTRAHMRAAGMMYVRSVPWIRAQCDHEFASVDKLDEAALHNYITNANQGAVDQAGLLILRRCHTTSGRIFIAFHAEYLAHMAERFEDEVSA